MWCVMMVRHKYQQQQANKQIYDRQSPRFNSFVFSPFLVWMTTNSVFFFSILEAKQKKVNTYGYDSLFPKIRLHCLLQFFLFFFKWNMCVWNRCCHCRWLVMRLKREYAHNCLTVNMMFNGERSLFIVHRYKCISPNMKQS